MTEEELDVLRQSSELVSLAAELMQALQKEVEYLRAENRFLYSLLGYRRERKGAGRPRIRSGEDNKRILETFEKRKLYLQQKLGTGRMSDDEALILLQAIAADLGNRTYRQNDVRERQARKTLRNRISAARGASRLKSQ